MPLGNYSNIAMRRAASMNLSNKRPIGIQNPLTPGQVTTGQASQYEPTKADNAAPKETGMVNPNMPGVSTGTGGAQTKQVDKRAMLDAVGKSSSGVKMDSAVAPLQSSPLAIQQAQQGTQSTSGAGLAISPQATAQAYAPATIDTQASQTPDNMGYSKAQAPSFQQTGAAPMGAEKYANIEPQVQMPAELPVGWTQEEWDLYQKFLSGEGLSEQEKAWLMDKLGRTRSETLEQLNRAQGASGGNSALEVLGGAEAERTYQSGLADIANQDYQRKLQQMQMAAQMATNAGNRTQNISDVWDKYVTYFNGKGYNLDADGTLRDSSGNKVDISTLRPEDAQMYQNFLNDNKITNPYADDNTNKSGMGDADQSAEAKQARLDKLLQAKYGVTFAGIINKLTGSGYFKDANGNYHDISELGPEWQDVITGSAGYQMNKPNLDEYVKQQLVKIDPLLQMGSGGEVRQDQYNSLIQAVSQWIRQNGKPPSIADLSMLYDQYGVGKPPYLTENQQGQVEFEEVPAPWGGTMKVPKEPKFANAFEL